MYQGPLPLDELHNVFEGNNFKPPFRLGDQGTVVLPEGDRVIVGWSGDVPTRISLYGREDEGWKELLRVEESDLRNLSAEDNRAGGCKFGEIDASEVNVKLFFENGLQTSSILKIDNAS